MSRPSRLHRLRLALATLCFTLPLAVLALTGPADEDLASLRADAQLGNVEASSQLAARLLDDYERTGDREALREAVHWIARDWDKAPFLRNEAADLVVSGHCERLVLKSHWLCRRAD
jgi:hypothetical protein